MVKTKVRMKMTMANSAASKTITTVLSVKTKVRMKMIMANSAASTTITTVLSVKAAWSYPAREYRTPQRLQTIRVLKSFLWATIYPGLPIVSIKCAHPISRSRESLRLRGWNKARFFMRHKAPNPKPTSINYRPDILWIPRNEKPRGTPDPPQISVWTLPKSNRLAQYCWEDTIFRPFGVPLEAHRKDENASQRGIMTTIRIVFAQFTT
mmetsp:Transcript_20339/g.44273  ORF Transcript_20339/g.44273 Transcript_20339/m.44273 type:complete len:209 (-) Transcript_20339:672-1298(-)